MLRPQDEAAQLVDALGAHPARLDAAVARRIAGEPLARILGWVEVDGLRLGVDPDVYIPRWTTGALARAAASRLPPDGRAVDLCTGAGVVAALLARARPGTTILATDLAPAAVATARRNGVDAHLGDLFGPLPRAWAGTVDVVAAVPPFVPRDALDGLAPDVRATEPLLALDGGDRGLEVASRIATAASGWLAPDGWLVVEVGSAQVATLGDRCRDAGLGRVEVLLDDDGEPCGVAAARVRETAPPVESHRGEP